uniref:Uncharacterized protein n=1 Tax=Anguilla anguilla TaxID=7936 RepID=A0A0E9WWE9_ANGAN
MSMYAPSVGLIPFPLVENCFSKRQMSSSASVSKNRNAPAPYSRMSFTSYDSSASEHPVTLSWISHSLLNSPTGAQRAQRYTPLSFVVRLRILKVRPSPEGHSMSRDRFTNFLTELVCLSHRIIPVEWPSDTWYQLTALYWTRCSSASAGHLKIVSSPHATVKRISPFVFSQNRYKNIRKIMEQKLTAVIVIDH